jgi:hypothetical protein
MGLLGRQFSLKRSTEDSLLLVFSTLTFTVSLFCGYVESGIGQMISLPLFGIEFHLVSTPIWLLSGILCLICLQQLFYKIWTHGVWLIGVYWLTAFGSIILFVMFDQGYVWFIVSLILIFLAIFLMYWMILEIVLECKAIIWHAKKIQTYQMLLNFYTDLKKENAARSKQTKGIETQKITFFKLHFKRTCNMSIFFQ